MIVMGDKMNLQVDSRKIKKGDTFVAIKDGHNYIMDAIKNGASKIVAEKGNYEVETLIVDNTYEYLLNYLKQFDLSKINLIGITGTNGKTTTCYLIYYILNQLGIKTSYIGTIGFYIDNYSKELNNTTPGIIELYEMILESIEKNCEYIVMEVSSHALDQNRIGDLEFKYTGFTNLTQDHLDYHKTMEQYALAKQKLFLKTSDTSFINVDDQYFNIFLLEQNNNVTYGMNDSINQISDIKISTDKTEFKINGDKYITNLIGKHNIYNLTLALSIIKKITNEDLKEIVEKLPYPKGRMDIVEYGTNKIIVDYAHTPDAVEKIINSIKELNPNHIYTIIGCGGGRDKTKRSLMASIALTSDFAIFTSDNPRNEEPMDIINDMINNLEKTNYEVVINRKEAIKKGIQMLTDSDILLVLGKGHENYQIVNGVKHYFDDKEEILKEL